ncbi:hypothetical protein H0484_02965 [Pusillimonas sp. CC-YST705]|uniref:DUF3426 domain-containing protein n=1 Tax=Mesopusillimonas faecipullorum TaxID=2755040 RepID=A0ABS8C9K6_9BURK|nr:hypothetical protein [Mesopusillimonas faecipullorum]MCB5362716.1 hypothetical protein [Mesopusillimonas faecipullorum]
MAKQTRSLLRRAARRALAASGVTIAVLYSWWQIIEAAREPGTLPATSMGTPLALGRVELTPTRLQLRPALDSQNTTGLQLVLSAQVLNMTGETQSAPFGYPPRLVTANHAGVTLEAPQVQLLRDHEPLLQLQPRMPEEVEIIWQLPARASPEPLQLTFFHQQFKLKDNLYGRSNWLGYSALAHLTTTPEPAP